MRIAFTHNLATSRTEEHAEFDSPATIELIVDTLRGMGHDVRPVEVSGPIARTVAALEDFRPDLVFNTAEGRTGRVREAFVPALLEELGIPYTGSGPHALTVTLDKYLTKLVVSQFGVRTPTARRVFDAGAIRPDDLRFPVIVKPNFEGSSKGITTDSVVDDRSAMADVVAAMLQRYADGVLVEEFIAGSDVTVPFLEAVGGPRGGVLSAVEYGFRGTSPLGGRTLYDYALKAHRPEDVSVSAPARLTDEQASAILDMTRTAIRALEIRDIGRLDYRLASDGTLFFLEANALPSLEPGAGLYAAAALEGLGTLESVLAAVVESAVRRWGLVDRPFRRSQTPTPLRVGFTYNEKRVRPDIHGEQDSEAEFEAPEVLNAIRHAIVGLGYEVVNLEATSELPRTLLATHVDVVFNLAEGASGRSRESQVPALLELMGLPFSGSDAVCMALTLDKALAKQVVASLGVPTPKGFVMKERESLVPPGSLRFPAIVKPLAEGSSKGISPHSVVHDEEAMYRVARAAIEKYRAPALIEEYLPGREFTVGLLGYPEARVLPVLEIQFIDPSVPTPVYSFEAKQHDTGRMRFTVPAELSDDQVRTLTELARTAFNGLGCRDMARIDFRMDAEGRFNFIECNPLPGLTPEWSDFVTMAGAAGIDYTNLIGSILAGSIERRGNG